MNYLAVGYTVRYRYGELTGKAKGNRQGAYDSEECADSAVLIGKVMKQDPAAFENLWRAMSRTSKAVLS